MVYLDTEASFVEKEPTQRALLAKLRLNLMIRLRGPKTKAHLQGATAELRAKRENEEQRATRWQPSAEDVALAQRQISGDRTQGPDDSEGPGGDV